MLVVNQFLNYWYYQYLMFIPCNVCKGKEENTDENKPLPTEVKPFLPTLYPTTIDIEKLLGKVNEAIYNLVYQQTCINHSIGRNSSKIAIQLKELKELRDIINGGYCNDFTSFLRVLNAAKQTAMGCVIDVECVIPDYVVKQTDTTQNCIIYSSTILAPNVTSTIPIVFNTFGYRCTPDVTITKVTAANGEDVSTFFDLPTTPVTINQNGQTTILLDYVANPLPLVNGDYTLTIQEDSCGCEKQTIILTLTNPT